MEWGEYGAVPSLYPSSPLHTLHPPYLLRQADITPPPLTFFFYFFLSLSPFSPHDLRRFEVCAVLIVVQHPSLDHKPPLLDRRLKAGALCGMRGVAFVSGFTFSFICFFMFFLSVCVLVSR